MAEKGSKKGSNKKTANRLVAASCGAVLAVYTAGYARTQSAATRLAHISERRAPGSSSPRAPLVEARMAASGTPAASASSSLTPSGSGKSSSGASTEPTQIASVTKEPSPAPIAETTSPATQVTTPVTMPATPQVTAAPATPAVEPRVEVAAAAPPSAVPPSAPAPSAPAWKDGLYYGWGYSRHGDIQAAVVIERGRISYATIYDCRTRYSCSVISQLPPQVGQRQSPEVDFVSGATESANAFYGAVVEALSKAK